MTVSELHYENELLYVLYLQQETLWRFLSELTLLAENGNEKPECLLIVYRVQKILKLL